MATYTAVILLCTLLSAVTANVLDDYIKTEEAWIFSFWKKEYNVKAAIECAEKCNGEKAFTCRSFMYFEIHQECVTVSTNSKFEEIVRGMRTVLYEKKVYLVDCKNGIGKDYRGTMSKTKSGKTCQKWVAAFPHIPSITPTTHPAAGLEYNFCRNPDGDKNGPWCYTMDTDTRWEHCDVQDCNTNLAPHDPEECMHCRGEDYRGKVSATELGFTCQRWDSQKPHSHGYIPELLPEKFLEENYCRNPDGGPRPWCLTTTPSNRWDYCSIPHCASPPPTVIEELTCATGEGSAYRGNISVTQSGKTCQMWSSQTPHKHSRTPENYPCNDLTQNYCRNPDNEKMSWCYTTDHETRWEYCKVPSCSEGHSTEIQVMQPAVTPVLDCYQGNGMSYRGVTSETISGRQCQFWTSMQPHAHKRTPQRYPKADLANNFCRNPDGDSAPWCYTTDPSVRWEFCKVEKCLDSPEEADVQPILPKQEADCKEENGQSYRGPTSITAKGVTCQAWNAQSPHVHASFTPETHPDIGLDSNQCRNPDNDANGPWCYTTDPKKKWDYCNIPDCGSQ